MNAYKVFMMTDSYYVSLVIILVSHVKIIPQIVHHVYRIALDIYLAINVSVKRELLMVEYKNARVVIQDVKLAVASLQNV